MITELITFSSLQCRKCLSIITNLQLRINRYKRKNDKQKCILIIFLLESVYFICCCSITNTVFVSLHINYNKFIWTTRKNSRLRSSKLKVHMSNLQMISLYLVKFSTDILFPSLVSFVFFVLVLAFPLKLKIFILIHIRLCGQVSDYKKQGHFFALDISIL